MFLEIRICSVFRYDNVACWFFKYFVHFSYDHGIVWWWYVCLHYVWELMFIPTNLFVHRYFCIARRKTALFIEHPFLKKTSMRFTFFSIDNDTCLRGFSCGIYYTRWIIFSRTLRIRLDRNYFTLWDGIFLLTFFQTCVIFFSSSLKNDDHSKWFSWSRDTVKWCIECFFWWNDNCKIVDVYTRSAIVVVRTSYATHVFFL